MLDRAGLGRVSRAGRMDGAIRRYSRSYRLRAIAWNGLEGQVFVTTLKWTCNCGVKPIAISSMAECLASVRRNFGSPTRPALPGAAPTARLFSAGATVHRHVHSRISRPSNSSDTIH